MAESTTRALDIPEIVAAICDEIADAAATDLFESSAPLVQLAVTARRFQETALNSLWRTQTSLIPLLRCLPSDSWTESGPGNLVFSRNLVDADWERAKLYALKIKVLRLPDSFRLESSTWTEIALSLSPSNQHLLPALMELECPNDLNFFPHTRLYLPPTIVAIKIPSPIILGGNLGRSWMGSILISLPTICPEIRKITIEKHSEGQTGFDLNRSLSRFPSLHHLSVSKILTSDALQLLKSFPQLRTMYLDMITQDPTNPTARERLPVILLPFLREARIHGCSFKDVSRILNSIRSFHLRSFECASCTAGGQPANAWTELLVGLHRFRATTVRLHVREDLENNREPCDPFMLGSEILHHLFNLSGLTHIHIVAKAAPRIGDDFLASLSDACPYIQQLAIETVHTTPHPDPWQVGPQAEGPCVTLNGLVPLVRRCRYLAELGLVIDTQQSLLTEGYGVGFDAINLQVKTLWVGQSHISDSVSVSIALATIFPNLSMITTVGDCSCISTWRHVEDQLQVAAEIRRRVVSRIQYRNPGLSNV